MRHVWGERSHQHVGFLSWRQIVEQIDTPAVEKRFVHQIRALVQMAELAHSTDRIRSGEQAKRGMRLDNLVAFFLQGEPPVRFEHRGEGRENRWLGEVDFIDDQPEPLAHRGGQDAVHPERFAALDGPEADEVAYRRLAVHVRAHHAMLRTRGDLFDQTGLARTRMPDQHDAFVLDDIFDDVVKALREQVSRIDARHQWAGRAARHLDFADTDRVTCCSRSIRCVRAAWFAHGVQAALVRGRGRARARTGTRVGLESRAPRVAPRRCRTLQRRHKRSALPRIGFGRRAACLEHKTFAMPFLQLRAQVLRVHHQIDIDGRVALCLFNTVFEAIGLWSIRDGDTPPFGAGIGVAQVQAKVFEFGQFRGVHRSVPSGSAMSAGSKRLSYRGHVTRRRQVGACATHHRGTCVEIVRGK